MTRSFVVYGEGYCGWCKKTVLLLHESGEQFSYIPLNSSGVKPKGVPKNHKTIPIVFMNGKFIGGFSELQKELDQ